MDSKEIRYLEFLEHLPADTQEKSLIAIKGHLLLEVVLKEYIYERVRHPDRLRNKNITFVNLIDFASSLEDNNKIQWIWKALRDANKIRNALAHSLAPEKLDLLELNFVQYIVANDGELSVKTTEELKFENLTLAYFQLYDVILSSISIYNDKNLQLKQTDKEHSLEEIYLRVAKALVVEKEQNKKWYFPQRSNKAKRIW